MAGDIIFRFLGKDGNVDLALSYLNSSAEHGNEYAAQLLYNLSHSKNPSVAMAAFAERSQGEVVRRSCFEYGRTEHGIGHVHGTFKVERLS